MEEATKTSLYRSFSIKDLKTLNFLETSRLHKRINLCLNRSGDLFISISVHSKQTQHNQSFQVEKQCSCCQRKDFVWFGKFGVFGRLKSIFVR